MAGQLLVKFKLLNKNMDKKMKKLFAALLFVFLCAACSNKTNDNDIESLKIKCDEYESMIEQLQKENTNLRSERDSLNAVVENVRKWLYNK